MVINTKQCIGVAKYGGLTLICIAVLSACSEQRPVKLNTAENSIEFKAANSEPGIANRIAGASDTVVVNEVFGNGYISTTNGVAVSTGAIGNAGGFGINGSIASIIGNIGGFGFGGFGTFASIFTGSLPTTPPSGILLPPGAATEPPPGGFTPPVVGFTPPVGGFGPPPGSFNFTPPAFGGTTPPAAGGTPPANGTVPPATAGTNTNIVTITDTNLSEQQTALSNLDVDLLFVRPDTSASSGVKALAITETVTTCNGGGTMTRIVDDVDPPGPSTGDTRSTVFADCIRAASGNGPTINGSRGFTTDETVGTPFLTPTWSTQSTQFQNNLSYINATAGTSRVSNGSTSTGISVTDNNFINQNASGTGSNERTNASGTTTSNFTFDMNFDWDVTAAVYTISLNTDVETVATTQAASTLTTVVPFDGTIGQPPSSGQLMFTRISDNAATSIVLATAQLDGTVLVEADTDANGTIDTTATEPNWSGVLFNFFNF